MNHKAHILALGAQTKTEIIVAYRNGGHDFGRDVARRYIFEVAEAIAEFHGREEAAAIVYEVADNIVGKTPLADWKSFSAPPKTEAEVPATPPAAPTSPSWKDWLTDAWMRSRFIVGFFLGVWVGGRSS